MKNFFGLPVVAEDRHQLEDVDCRAARALLIERLSAEFPLYQNKKYAFVTQCGLPLFIMPIFTGREETTVSPEDAKKGVISRQAQWRKAIADCTHGFFVGKYNFGGHYVSYALLRSPQGDQMFIVDPMGNPGSNNKHVAYGKFAQVIPGEFSIDGPKIVQQYNFIDCGFISARNMANFAWDIARNAQKIIKHVPLPQAKDVPLAEGDVTPALLTVDKDAVIAKDGDAKPLAERADAPADIPVTPPMAVMMDVTSFDVPHLDRAKSSACKKAVVEDLKQKKIFTHFEIGGEEFVEEYTYDGNHDAQALRDQWEISFRSIGRKLISDSTFIDFVQGSLKQEGKTPKLPNLGKGHVATVGADDCMATLARRYDDVRIFMDAKVHDQDKFGFFISRCERVATELTKHYLFDLVDDELQRAIYDESNLEDQIKDKLTRITVQLGDGSSITLQDYLARNNLIGTYIRDGIPSVQRTIIMRKHAAERLQAEEGLRIEQCHKLVGDLRLVYNGLMKILTTPTLNKWLTAEAPKNGFAYHRVDSSPHEIQRTKLENILKGLAVVYRQVRYSSLSLGQIVSLRYRVALTLGRLVEEYFDAADLPQSDKEADEAYAQELKDYHEALKEVQKANTEAKSTPKKVTKKPLPSSAADPWGNAFANSGNAGTEFGFAYIPEPEKPQRHDPARFSAVQMVVSVFVELLYRYGKLNLDEVSDERLIEDEKLFYEQVHYFVDQSLEAKIPLIMLKNHIGKNSFHDLTQEKLKPFVNMQMLYIIHLHQQHPYTQLEKDMLAYDVPEQYSRDMIHDSSVMDYAQMMATKPKHGNNVVVRDPNDPYLASLFIPIASKDLKDVIIPQASVSQYSAASTSGGANENSSNTNITTDEKSPAELSKEAQAALKKRHYVDNGGYSRIPFVFRPTRGTGLEKTDKLEEAKPFDIAIVHEVALKK